MLSIDGWAVGIAYCVKITTDAIFSTFIIIKAKKKNITLLYLPAVVMIAAGFAYLSLAADFFHILLTNTNIQITNMTLLYFTTWGSVVTLSMNILGTSLTFSEQRKKIILSFVVIMVVFYQILVISLPYSGYSLQYPPSPGENLIKPYLASNSVVFYLVLISGVFLLIYALKLVLKSLKLKGELRIKFQMLAVGFIGGVSLIYLMTLAPNAGFIYAIIYLAFGYLTWIPLYYGLTPIKQKKPKKTETPSKVERKFVSYLTEKSSSDELVGGENVSSSNLNQDILIFMSYATKDADLFNVKEIAEKLTKSADIQDVLYWQEDMEDNIIEYMNDNIGKCHAMILFCSKAALDSIPVKKEWTAAEAAGLPIIPVFYDINHVPTLLKSRLGVEYDFYDLDRIVLELHSLILKKCGGLT